MIDEFVNDFLKESEENEAEILAKLEKLNECPDCEKQTDLDENALSESLDQLLNEVGSSTIRVSAKKKINMLAGASGLRLASKKNDPLFEKYKKFRGIALKIKSLLMKKYGSRGRVIARKALAR